MPELPDLLYITSHLKKEVAGKTIVAASVHKPLVLRLTVDSTLEEAVRDQSICNVGMHGPFLRFELSRNIELIVNLMLAGRIQHQQPREKAEGHLCCSFSLNDGTHLNISDPDAMAKVYVVKTGSYELIPRYREQGVDILSPAFTLDKFRELAKRNSRKQIRVFINDHTQLSSIGNAYADEILFDAGIHPKTFTSRLTDADVLRLHTSIRNVMTWGIEQVRAAGQPIEVKVRGHMKVRNRKGEKCPRCGTTIRREGVRGYDVFFCPTCQPASRVHFIDWTKTDTREKPGG
jgi:formamidopyrimidine-DNA glycosylase